MRVFISWSGAKSRDAAQAVRDWLPLVLHAIEPFVSSKDIRAGTRWQAEIAGELDQTDFGLICVTQENQRAEWLNFEAGALAKSVESSRVVPLAIDLSPADIANPLGQFQAMRLTKEDMTEVLLSINETTGRPISTDHLRRGVDKWWPDLQEKLDVIGSRTYETKEPSSEQVRSDRELLEEVLTTVRGLGRTGELRRSPSLTLDRVSGFLREALTRDYGEWSLAVRGRTIYLGLLAGTPPPTANETAERLAVMRRVWDVDDVVFEEYDPSEFHGDNDEDEDES